MGQIPIETQHEQPDPDEVLSELKALERSCFFARQGRQRTILCYILEQPVAGPGPSQFKERAIGVASCRRKAVYDIFCEDEKGNQFIVEMQNAKQLYFKDRALYYSTFQIVGWVDIFTRKIYRDIVIDSFK